MQQSAASPTAGSVTPEKRLLHASAAGDAAIVRRLLKVIPAALPALFLAVQSNHSDIVTLLLSANPALANSCLANGCSPLYTAASKGFVRVAKALLSHGATVDLPSTSGATALFVACQHGQVAMASALLGAKADPAARDSTGATPLYVACQNGQLGTVDALLRRHGDRSGTGGGTGGGTAAVVDTVGLNAAKASGATPLYVSCQKGEAVIAARLLAAKAAVDQVTATGASALLVASLQGHAAVVDLLLAHNANPDLATRDGTTPIVAACSSDASVAVPPSASGKPPGAIPRALLAAGATVCLPGGKITPSGVTLIAAARRWGDEKLIRSLVRRAAPPAGRQMRPRVSRPSERESEQEEEAGDEADERGHACDDDDSAASSSDSDGETDGEQEDDDGSAGTTDDATSTSDEGRGDEIRSEVSSAPHATGGGRSACGSSLESGGASCSADACFTDASSNSAPNSPASDSTIAASPPDSAALNLGDPVSVATEAAASSSSSSSSSNLHARVAADSALLAALERGELGQLRDAIEKYCKDASVETLADARQVRDKLREKARKAAQQRRRMREQARRELRLAHARARNEAADALQAALTLQELEYAEGAESLRRAISAAESKARLLDGMGGEQRMEAARERLRHLERREAEEAEEEEAQQRRRPGADEGAERQPDLTPVEELEALPSATIESARPAAEAARPPPPPCDVSGECTVCLDATNSHVLVPCGHKCVCASCAALIKQKGTCPICRAQVLWACEVYE